MVSCAGVCLFGTVPVICAHLGGVDRSVLVRALLGYDLGQSAFESDGQRPRGYAQGHPKEVLSAISCDHGVHSMLERVLYDILRPELCCGKNAVAAHGLLVVRFRVRCAPDASIVVIRAVDASWKAYRLLHADSARY